MSASVGIDIEREAWAVWEVMHSEAKRLGMAQQRFPNLGDGRVLIGTTAQYIRILNKERGWGLSDHEVATVRNFLKASGNVVTLEKLADYRWRIFVREAYQQRIAVPVPVGSNSTRHKTEQEEETMEESPVVWKCPQHPDLEFDTQEKLTNHKRGHRPNQEKHVPVGVIQERILVHLARVGGEITDESGRLAGKLADSLNLRTIPSSQLRALARHGWVERDHSPEKRETYRVALTDEGYAKLRELGIEETPEYVEPDEEKRVPTLKVPTPKPQGDWVELDSVPLEDLLSELHDRVNKHTPDDRIELVQTVLADFSNGKLTPIKALSEIEEAINL